MKNLNLLDKKTIVFGNEEKHLQFVKDQIETLLPNTTWYENNYLNLFKPGHKTFVAELNGNPVSFCSFIIADSVADIEAIATKKEYQSMGFGLLCIKKGLEELKNDGIQTVLLEVERNNKKAIMFYEKLGFVFQNRTIVNYYNDGQDALIYALNLQ